MRYPLLLKGRPYLREQPMSLQLTSGSGGQTLLEAALRLNWRLLSLTLLSYSYCITGIPEPADT